MCSHIFKNLEVRIPQQHSAALRTVNSILCVWKCGKTRSMLSDILRLSNNHLWPHLNLIRRAPWSLTFQNKRLKNHLLLFQNYFRDFWNVFDFIIVITTLVGVILELNVSKYQHLSSFFFSFIYDILHSLTDLFIHSFIQFNSFVDLDKKLFASALLHSRTSEEDIVKNCMCNKIFPSLVNHPKGQWRPSSRPEFFPTLSSCSAGKTTETRIHHTNSIVDIPTVIQGERMLLLWLFV